MSSSQNKPLSVNDRQVGGTHYSAPYQHWDFVIDGGLSYMEAQITRYVARHRKKNGAEDIEKAIHYAEKLSTEAIAVSVLPNPFQGSARKAATRFITENGLVGTKEAQIILEASCWTDHRRDPPHIVMLLQDLLRDTYRGVGVSIMDPGEDERRQRAYDLARNSIPVEGPIDREGGTPARPR
jgi:hypothetical protein